ncbi:MAG: CDP-archaeol synthase [Nanoarchaeota archaeon]
MFLQVLYLLLPAAFANMAPIFFKDSWKWLDRPIDGNKKWKGKPILGSHKTWRGFIAGIVLGILVAFLQKQLWEAGIGRAWILINYEHLWLSLGFWMGFGAMFGDSVKSFFKRRSSVKPGDRFMPWDQIDWILGSLVFVSLFVQVLPWQVWAWWLIIGFAGHIIIRHISYWLKMDKDKW